MFFDRFRDAVSRLPVGLIRLSPPATQAEVAAAEAALEQTLPPSFVSFLRSFDGADLFHESVLIAGAGAAAPRRLVDLDREHGRPSAGGVVFAETPAGDRFVFRPDGAVVRWRGAAATSDGAAAISDSAAATSDEERWLAGSDFSKWLEATVAHQRLLYGPDGEFSPDAFEPDSGDILPRVALKQSEKALRLDPGAAELHHERGVALRRLERDDEAREAFRQAAELDPDNPWPWFELGRAALDAGVVGAPEALSAFERAGQLQAGEVGARFWLWAARAARLAAAPERLAACRREALARVPDLQAALQRACEAARALTSDEGDLAEAQAMVSALEDPIGVARSRLTIITDVAPRPKAAVATSPSPRPGSVPAARQPKKRAPKRRPS